jgi:hypothetical protein
MSRSASVLIPLSVLAVITTASYGAEVVFRPHKIDGPTGPGWYGPFSEGSAVFDVNRDGVLDITAGGHWYEGPFYRRHACRQADVKGEYISNCGEYGIDVNRDGWTDVVSTGWMDTAIYWFENPGKGLADELLWRRHKIIDSKATEGFMTADIDADGDPDLLPCRYNPEAIYWLENSDGGFVRRDVAGKEFDGHGIGYGDLNGDGRGDILTINGWLEAPANPGNGQWKAHQSWEIRHASIPMPVYDVDGDGDVDFLYGDGHDYGLYWMEQTGPDRWSNRLIDDTWSQSHNLELIDLDLDGNIELVTGKRLRGHNGSDPGADDPLGIYYYSINRKEKRFRKHVIVLGAHIGSGMQINPADLNGDGLPDLVVSGKSGLFWLENLGIRPPR